MAPRPEQPTPPPAAPFAPGEDRSRWAASFYAFVRPGGSRPGLAGGGELGGSQAAARIAYRLNRSGPVRTALAVRSYAPLHDKGAEVAAGLDWHPWPKVPVRLSVERRVALDRAGRSAWSAYGAGGFYMERLDGALVLDGYGQAGVVGARARDLFADGAVRAGHRVKLGPVSLAGGAGLWGGAQPGAARLDLGPRLGVTLPLAGHSFGLAVEGRFRVAGHARPGSGMALTLGIEL